MADGTGALLAAAWRAVSGLDVATGPPGTRAVVSGPSGHLPSRLPVEDVAVACVSTALLAAAALAEHAGAPVGEVAFDRSHVAAAVTSERHFRRRGAPGGGGGFAPLSRFWPTDDGWVRTHANFPWHRDALLAVTGTGAEPDAVAAALARLTAEEVEDRVVAAGGVAAAVRTLEAWGAHPQGVAVAREPLVAHELVGDARPRPRRGRGLPASGVRVLDLTRVIAGPVCTRFLGALGASVLRLDPPDRPDVRVGATADTLLAKRSAILDLAPPEGRAVLAGLLADADVVVCGYRPGALGRFGLDPAALAERHPGLVVVVLDAWGHTGPWAGRRGFDSIVQAPTGIATTEAPTGAAPGALPCQLLDHGTGYLAAAAALDGLRRQREGGGTHLRRVSLARTARWLTTAPGPRSTPPETRPAPDASAWLVELDSVEGPVHAVAPPGMLDGAPLRWPAPVTGYGDGPVRWPDD